MSRKQLISMWVVIASIVFSCVSGRVLFPVYSDVFHGIIVLVFLVTMLTCSSISPSETNQTNGQKIADKTRRRAGVLTVIKSLHGKSRKRPTVCRIRKRKKRIR